MVEIIGISCSETGLFIQKGEGRVQQLRVFYGWNLAVRGSWGRGLATCVVSGTYTSNLQNNVLISSISRSKTNMNYYSILAEGFILIKDLHCLV